MICSFAFYQSSYSWQAEGAVRKYVDFNSSEFAIKKIRDNLIRKSDMAVDVECVCTYMCKCALLLWDYNKVLHYSGY